MEEEVQGHPTGAAAAAGASTASNASAAANPLIRQLIDAIEENLQNHLPANAVFLAERLLAEHDTEETRGILAESYMAENKHYKVFEILKHCKSEMNRYKFALVCLKLNKHDEGERALLYDHDQEMTTQQKLKLSTMVDIVPPNGCYGYYLLGLIQEGRQKYDEAKDYYIKALELNPTLWTAYEKICKIGDQEVIPYKVFSEARYKQYQANKKVQQQQQQQQAQQHSTIAKNLKESRIFNDEAPEEQQGGNQKMPRYITSAITREQGLQRTPGQPTKVSSIAGPVAATIPGLSAGLITGSGVRNESNSRNSSAKRKKATSKVDNPISSLQTQAAASVAGSSSLASSQIVQPSSSTSIQGSGLIGVGSQQFSAASYSTIVGASAAFEIPNTMHTKLPSAHSYNFQNPQSTSQFMSAANASALMAQDFFGLKAQQSGTTPQLNFPSQQQHHHNQQQFAPLPTYAFGSAFEGGSHQPSSSIRDICTLLRRFGEAFYHMSLYLCKEAIEQFNNLPRNHYQTGWVLTHIGRCYMEIVKYSEAEKYYAEALRIEPYRLEGIEYYSSCLWHLKKQVDLCYLAQQALEKAILAPETWIAVGNCFSLQKEHENALKFFQRAIQLNPKSAYAHSLCGHEFVYNEDFARARKSFEKALNADKRNYNAWWGLGNIYYKQEKYSRAAEHFQKAININQKNPVLFSFMGMSLAADRKFKKALEYFECSEKLDPKNGLNKFQKANTLVKLEKYEAALKELKELHLMMPREAPIPMLMGKVYKKLKMTDMALKYFTDALDLENKDSQRIKALIESLHHDNHDFAEDMDI